MVTAIDKRTEDALMATEKENFKKRKERMKQKAVAMYSPMQVLWALIMCLVPAGIFCGNLYNFLYYYHTMYEECFFIPVVIMGVGFVVGASDFNSRRGGQWYLFFGFLCATAALVSMIIGVYIYRRVTYFSFAMEDKRTYRNVLPAEPPASVLDASKIYFAFDAVVDVTRSVGFKAQGNTYCVAPILDSNDASRVNFFAAGFNCCADRQGFECDGAWDKNTHGGAVILDELRPRMAPSDLDMFRHAGRQAEAVYGMSAAQAPVFVRWMGDPSALEASYFATGKEMVKSSCIWASGFSVVLGVVASWVSVKRKKEQAKEDARLQALG